AHPPNPPGGPHPPIRRGPTTRRPRRATPLPPTNGTGEPVSQTPTRRVQRPEDARPRPPKAAEAALLRLRHPRPAGPSPSRPTRPLVPPPSIPPYHPQTKGRRTGKTCWHGGPRLDPPSPTPRCTAGPPAADRPANS